MVYSCCGRDVWSYLILLDLDSIYMYLFGLNYSLKNKVLGPNRDDNLFLSSSVCPATAESQVTF